MIERAKLVYRTNVNVNRVNKSVIGSETISTRHNISADNIII